MDSRTKIVELEIALAGGLRTAVVTGYFDPLTAEHARRLREIRSAGFERMVVVLSNPLEPILEARARAELVAALDVIDYVVLPQKRASSVEFERQAELSVFREEAADEARFERLVEYVRQRNQPSSL